MIFHAWVLTIMITHIFSHPIDVSKYPTHFDTKEACLKTALEALKDTSQYIVQATCSEGYFRDSPKD